MQTHPKAIKNEISIKKQTQNGDMSMQVCLRLKEDFLALIKRFLFTLDAPHVHAKLFHVL